MTVFPLHLLKRTSCWEGRVWRGLLYFHTSLIKAELVRPSETSCLEFSKVTLAKKPSLSKSVANKKVAKHIATPCDSWKASPYFQPPALSCGTCDCWFLWQLAFFFFLIWVAMDATMKSICGLLQDLDAIVKGSETVVMVPLENTWQRSPITVLIWMVLAKLCLWLFPRVTESES